LFVGADGPTGGGWRAVKYLSDHIISCSQMPAVVGNRSSAKAVYAVATIGVRFCRETTPGGDTNMNSETELTWLGACGHKVAILPGPGQYSDGG
jgi:hypothetical protein